MFDAPIDCLSIFALDGNIVLEDPDFLIFTIARLEDLLFDIEEIIILILDTRIIIAEAED